MSVYTKEIRNQIMDMYYIDGLSMKDISIKLKVSLEAVKNLIATNR